jgi:S-DNA-T family DNA segregation ATPase FtsK/SpoIIIE
MPARRYREPVRMTLTAVDPVSGTRADVLADLDDAATVGEALGAVAVHVRAAPQPAYIDGVLLDAAVTVGDSRLRDGCVVSFGSPAACVPPEPPGVVELRLVGGPDAGLVHRLATGEYDVGAAADCGVVLAAPGVLSHEFALAVTATGRCALTPYDGTALTIDGETVTGAVEWLPGQVVDLGSVLLQLARPTGADAALVPSPDGAGLDYNRPPRLHPPVRETRFRLPAEPREMARRPMPLVMALVPLVGSVAMAIVAHRPQYLFLAALSPIAMLGNHFSDRKHGRRTHRAQVADYRAHRDRVMADAQAALAVERAARRAHSPDPAELLLTAVGPRRRLWERRRHDDDHLLLRVGTADVPATVSVEDPALDEHRRQSHPVAHAVPVTVSLRDRGVVGIAGRGSVAAAVTRALVGQVGVLHSPRDVQLYVLTDSQARASWEWVRWLPHTRPADGQDTFALVGSDNDSVARRIGELGAILAARRDEMRDEPSVRFASDLVVVLDGARRLRAMPGVAQVLRDGPAVGLYVVCLDAEERLLPEECQAVVTVAESGRLHVRQMRAEAIDDVRPDAVPDGWAERVARALAPIRDTGADDDAAAIPTSARLLDVLALDAPTASAIAERWAAGGRTTEFAIGLGLDGPLSLDLVRDGPHGLIAGTTGSGKSELLQSIVASLAVANRPDAMTFVLVDYKGGSAFKDCVHLPHTVGMVTDLDAHLVGRALESLSAELRRREHMLAAAGAKDIEDYVTLTRGDPSLATLPRLLIVIDEFASMVRDLPDFVTGLVNIAQRGRSLGIHLLLATQRPSGVVSPEIRANTNLRIALRVTDAGESSDVIGSPDAARVAKSMPGRAYARLGHASLIPFQSGRVGGRRAGAATSTRRPPFVVPIDAAALGRPAPARPADATDDGAQTDLAALVSAVREAHALLGLAPQHSPWLAALATDLLLDEIAVVPAAGPLPVVPFGIEDVPAEQRQRAACLDFATFGHLLVAGSSRSGRSQLLRTLAGSIGRFQSPADVQVYGIDCGNGALLPVADLPHCGAVVTRTQPERARRLLARLVGEVARRQELLARLGVTDIGEQLAVSPADDRLPHIVVLLDRWEGFASTLGELDNGALTEAVFQLLREGATVGVHLVIVGDRSVLASRLAAMSEDRLTFRMADRADYTLAGLSPRSMPDDPPAGRAFRAESGREIQVALLGRDASGAGQAAALREIAAEARLRGPELARARRPFRVELLPSRLSLDDAWALVGEPDPLWGLVGVGGDEWAAYGVDFAGTPTFVAGGPPRSGRSGLLAAMAAGLLRRDVSLVLATPRPSPLRAFAGCKGVLASYEGPQIPSDLGDILASAEGPVVVLVDDAELVKDCAAADVLRETIRHGAERGHAVAIAGSAEDLCTGFSGWQVDVKRGRQGALLSPQGVGDGDLIGVRLPRSTVGQPIAPGRALLHLGDGELVTVQVPAVCGPSDVMSV